MTRIVAPLLATAAALALFAAPPATSADKGDDGFKPLFNGKNFDGWVVVNGSPKTWSVKDDGTIVTAGKPTGLLRSEKMYENFIADFEWKHLEVKGNSGMFLWASPVPNVGSPFASGIEVQVLSDWDSENHTSHGDLFSVGGAKCVPDRPHPKGWSRCLPSEKRCKPTGEWNHYVVTAKDGVVKLEVNGKEVSGLSKCTPRKGYLCLESEGSECHFRNLKIKELPSSKPAEDEVAATDQGFRSIFTGLDLDGWKVEEGHKGHWDVKDNRIVYDGKSEAKDKDLWSEKEYGDFEMIVDWKLPGEKKKVKWPLILPSGLEDLDENKKPKEVEVEDAGDSGIYLRGNSKSQVNIWCRPVGSGEVYGYRTDPKVSAEVRQGVTPKEKADKKVGEWNRFIITMKGDRLTVVLNGKTVIENAQLPDVPAKGRIALQHHGDQVEFTNLYIRELK